MTVTAQKILLSQAAKLEFHSMLNDEVIIINRLLPSVVVNSQNNLLIYVNCDLLIILWMFCPPQNCIAVIFGVK